MEKGFLIVNPASGRGNKRKICSKIIERAREADLNLEMRVSEYPGHLSVIAKEAVSSGIESVVILGGDGSLREAGEVLAQTSISIYLIPAGTSNVFARSLKIPLDPVKATDLFQRGKEVMVDAGEVNGNKFFFMCGSGIDANVMAGAHLPSKKIFGRASFYPSVVKEFFTYSFSKIEVDVDGKIAEGTYVAVMNIPHFAGPYILCPSAQWNDGLLDVIVFSGKRLSFLRHFWKLLLKKPLTRGILHLKGRNILIKGSEDIHFQVDGDEKGCLPAKIGVLPGALRMVV